MKRKISKKYVVIVSVFLNMSLLLSACSGSPAEGSANNPSKIQTMAETSEAGETSKSEEIPSGSASSPLGDTIYHLGDTIEFSYFDEGTIQYTLDEVKIGTNINEMGLSAEHFNGSYLFQEDGAIAEPDHSFVAARVTVKNIDADMSETAWTIEGAAGDEASFLAEDGPFAVFACYYSDCSLENENDFYKIALEAGEEKQIVIAWTVPNAQLESTFYYAIGASLSPSEDWKYFVLSEGREQ